jgi:hypothetical protein
MTVNRNSRLINPPIRSRQPSGAGPRKLTGVQRRAGACRSAPCSRRPYSSSVTIQSISCIWCKISRETRIRTNNSHPIAHFNQCWKAAAHVSYFSAYVTLSVKIDVRRQMCQRPGQSHMSEPNYAGKTFVNKSLQSTFICHTEWWAIDGSFSTPPS